MGLNRFKSSSTQEPKKKGKSLFSVMETVFPARELFKDGIPVQYFPKLLFVSFLGILYIANSHFAEKTIRKIAKLKIETENLRADFTTLKADYMFSSKQSEVAKKVEKLGLYESVEPPVKIKLSETED